MYVIQRNSTVDPFKLWDPIAASASEEGANAYVARLRKRNSVFQYRVLPVTNADAILQLDGAA
jgi:hypothetical protein